MRGAMYEAGDWAMAWFDDGERALTELRFTTHRRSWHVVDLLLLWPAFCLMRLASRRFRERWPHISFVSALTGFVYHRAWATEQTMLHELRHVVQMRRTGRVRHVLNTWWPPAMIRLEAEAYFFDGSSVDRAVASLTGGAYILLIGEKRLRAIVEETYAHWAKQLEES